MIFSKLPNFGVTIFTVMTKLANDTGAITCAVNPGDEVILFEPAYDAYAPDIQLSGGIPVYVTMKP